MVNPRDAAGECRRMTLTIILGHDDMKYKNIEKVTAEKSCRYGKYGCLSFCYTFIFNVMFIGDSSYHPNLLAYGLTKCWWAETSFLSHYVPILGCACRLLWQCTAACQVLPPPQPIHFSGCDVHACCKPASEVHQSACVFISKLI